MTRRIKPPSWHKRLRACGIEPERFSEFQRALLPHRITTGWNPNKKAWSVARVGSLPDGPTHLALWVGDEGIVDAIERGPDAMVRRFDSEEGLMARIHADLQRAGRPAGRITRTSHG